MCIGLQKNEVGNCSCIKFNQIKRLLYLLSLLNNIIVMLFSDICVTWFWLTMPPKHIKAGTFKESTFYIYLKWLHVSQNCQFFASRYWKKGIKSYFFKTCMFTSLTKSIFFLGKLWLPTRLLVFILEKWSVMVSNQIEKFFDHYMVDNQWQ